VVYSPCFSFLAEISLARNRLLSPAAYERSARHSAGAVIAEVWREAEEELRRSNAFSFDDLLVGAVELLAEHPHRLADYRERWKWVVVDEFQTRTRPRASWSRC
jgi:DNA helicase II / ATP-dependent DNA helicase PcrA